MSITGIALLATLIALAAAAVCRAARRARLRDDDIRDHEWGC